MASLFGNRRKSDEADDPPQSARNISTPPRPSSPQALGFETVLGPSTVLEGKFKSSGNIRLDGTFSGTLEITGNVLVGETAKIYADIDAKNISVAGAVRGNVSGNKVQLLRTGKVWGDITATALTTEEGAFIDGKITMQSAPPPMESPAEATASEPAPVADPTPTEPTETDQEEAKDD
jgi:cytoskeletal protein CcmA (bactofilin family)